jgi:hypothetical protein
MRPLRGAPESDTSPHVPARSRSPAFMMKTLQAVCALLLLSAVSLATPVVDHAGAGTVDVLPTPAFEDGAVKGGKAEPRQGSLEKAKETPAKAACFPAAATVRLDSGAVRRMDEILVGDRVHVGGGVYSTVFMFTHKRPDAVHQFVALQTASGKQLRLTPGHFLYVNGDLAAAGTVAAGDTVELANGDMDLVSSAAPATDVGLYNPQTLHGDVVVDGVRTSTYTQAVEPAVAHASLAGLRFLYRVAGVSTSLLDRGAPAAAARLLA